mgnify:CR=1 FL=1
MEEQTKFGKFHDKFYKHLLLIPAIILILGFGYIYYFYSVHGDFISKDISLTGGTTITLYSNFDVTLLKQDLSKSLENLNIRSIYDLTTNEQKAVIIETTSNGEIVKEILEKYLDYQLTEDNSSFEFTGSTLSQSFYRQLLFAILLAFIFMSIVVFIIFRTFVPSIAVMISAFADIFMTLIVVDLLGLKVSSASIVAFLMLIGYSVDTDILLTTRMLKRSEGSLNDRIFSAFKTGMTMSLTSFLGVLFALLVVRSFSPVLTQIFSILTIGLIFDIFNTWITNASILKWHLDKHETHI